ncbi:MAG: hypothetical protein QOK23_4821 [Gammaproteobacteria bacterium]|jgi:FkbM family methyltransferase|nr:hypothetical protein [Gammaproteobacteria bacterium]
MNVKETAPKEILRDAVYWSYILFLGREERDPSVIDLHIAKHQTIEGVRQTFMQSEEFTERKGRVPPQEQANSLFSSFPRYAGPPEEGFFYDFLGTKTRCDYLPDTLSHLSGRVYGLPGTGDDELHELSEWTGTLQAVKEAKERGRLVVAELGAGWGPWLVTAAKAATHLQIPTIVLVGVEGSREHLAFMHQHFRDNDLNPNDHTLLHSIVGVRDGSAYFPVLPVPREDWGAKAIFDESVAAGDVEEVPSISLATLANDHPPFDLIHCDIQGAEGDVLPAAAEVLNSRVRRIVVGTHSRQIEGKLLEFFSSCGWVLEHETPCRYQQALTGGVMNLLVDGSQIWRNPREI